MLPTWLLPWFVCLGTNPLMTNCALAFEYCTLIIAVSIFLGPISSTDDALEASSLLYSSINVFEQQQVPHLRHKRMWGLRQT